MLPCLPGNFACRQQTTFWGCLFSSSPYCQRWQIVLEHLIPPIKKTPIKGAYFIGDPNGKTSLHTACCASCSALIAFRRPAHARAPFAWVRTHFYGFKSVEFSIKKASHKGRFFLLVIPTGFEPILPPWKGDVLTIRRWDRFYFKSIYTCIFCKRQELFCKKVFFYSEAVLCALRNDGLNLPRSSGSY